MLLRGDDLPIKQLENVVLTHSVVYAAAPVSESIQPVAVGLQPDEQVAHTLHLADDEIGVAFAKQSYLVSPLRHGLLHVTDDMLKRAVTTVYLLIPFVIHEMVIEFLCLCMACEKAVYHTKIVVVDKYLSEIENEVSNHKYCIT